MQKINSYLWKLYKESPKGKKTIESFERFSNEPLSIKSMLDITYEFDEDYLRNGSMSYWRNKFQLFKDDVDNHIASLSFTDIEKSKNSANKLFEKLNSQYEAEFPFIKPYRLLMSHIVPISLCLHKKNPEYFLPYLFLIRYRYLHQIISDYSIDINEKSDKFSYSERLNYYLELCEVFYQFRQLNKMSMAELCAFLYDMERETYDSDLVIEDTKYPRAWLLVGGKGDLETDAEEMYWQGNAEIRKGDICVFYETLSTLKKEDRKSITGIWVAQDDGHRDPFFYFYELIHIGKEHKLSKPLPFNKLLTDPRIQKLPHLGANLNGACGSELTGGLYEQGILALIKEWNPTFDDSSLPQMYHPELPMGCREDHMEIDKEKWVEDYRIIPLLNDMGFVKDRDFLQQVYLQLGREKDESQKIQAGKTDFSLFPFGNKRKDTYLCADVLIEAKAQDEMTTPKKIKQAFWQAESYASRQYAQLLIITDGDQFILYPRSKDGIFRYSEPEKMERYTWSELSDKNSDSFKRMHTTIMSYKKHS